MMAHVKDLSPVWKPEEIGNKEHQLCHPLCLALGPFWKDHQELIGNENTMGIRQKQVDLSLGRLRSENSKEI